MANLEDAILSVDEKAQITAQREKQWAAELFGHRLNREAALALGEVDSSTDEAIVTLETALTTLAEQKQKIDAEVAAKAKAEAIK